MPVARTRRPQRSPTTGGALGHLGRSWWAWVVLGGASHWQIDGHTPPGFVLVGIGVTSWVAFELLRVGRSLGPRFQPAITALAAWAICIEIIDLGIRRWTTGSPMAYQVCALIGLVAYATTMGRFAGTLPGSGDVTRAWRRARIPAGTALGAWVVFGLLAWAADTDHALHGVNPLTVSIFVAVAIGTVGSLATLLLVARAHYLTRIGFTTAQPTPEIDSVVR